MKAETYLDRVTELVNEAKSKYGDGASGKQIFEYVVAGINEDFAPDMYVDADDKEEIRQTLKELGIK